MTKILTEFSAFAAQTSVHGFAHLVKNRSDLVRCLWLAILLVSFGIAITMLNSTITGNLGF